MKQRCLNKHSKDYEHYGARGISVYQPWSDSYEEFRDYVHEHLGPRPQGRSLDRINNDGNYEPGNIRWATLSEQNSNRRFFHRHGIHGQLPANSTDR